MTETLSVLDVISRSADFLTRKGVENARLNAEWLIAHAMGVNRMQLYLQFDRPLKEEEKQVMRGFVARRGKREPLQYIIGETQFHNAKLKVDRRALIPRPETEQLVELVKESLSDPTGKYRILDLGTGTGAIAIALAMEFPMSEVWAVDRSREALSLAKENLGLNCVDDRVACVESNWFSNIEPETHFDLIVSNPPYLTTEEMGTAEPEVLDFEPESALLAAEQGMRDLFAIIRESKDRLKDGGALWLETGIAQREPLLAACNEAGYTRSQGYDDWSERERFIHAVK